MREESPKTTSVFPACAFFAEAGHRLSCKAQLKQHTSFFPTCQVRVTRFYQSDAGASPRPLPRPRPPLPPLPPASSSWWALPDLICQLKIAVICQPQDRSGHCRTSSARFRSQCATPDLNRELQIAVGTAGPQPRVPDRSGQRRTATASSDRISDRTLERMPDRMSDRMSERYAR